MVSITIKINEKLYNQKIANALNDILTDLYINENKIIGQYVLKTDFCKNDGQAFALDVEDLGKYYIMISMLNAKDARNAFIAQAFPPVLKSYINDYSNHKFKIYLFDEMRITSNYVHFNIRCFKTIFDSMVIVNNKNSKLTSLSPFNSIQDLKQSRQKNSERNSKNVPTYIFEDSDEVIIFGKSDGANLGDSILMILAINKILAGETRILSVMPYVHNNSTKKHTTLYSNENMKIISNAYNLKVCDELRMYDKETEDDEKAEIRNQNRFRINLMEKFNGQKCVLCDCQIGPLIIASHIHRITDIKKSSLPYDKKVELAVHKDNGLWLCANHDKMFENGIITFKKDGNVVRHKLDLGHHSYYNYITTNLSIDKSAITPDLIKFLILHHKRVGYEEPI